IRTLTADAVAHAVRCVGTAASRVAAAAVRTLFSALIRAVGSAADQAGTALATLVQRFGEQVPALAGLQAIVRGATREGAAQFQREAERCPNWVRQLDRPSVERAVGCVRTAGSRAFAAGARTLFSRFIAAVGGRAAQAQTALEALLQRYADRFPMLARLRSS